MNNPAIEPVAKKYAELRYQLMPYTYTLAREAYDTGMPLMRACGCIIRTTSGRAGIAGIPVGPRPADCPRLRKGATSRDVYLPPALVRLVDNARTPAARP